MTEIVSHNAPADFVREYDYEDRAELDEYDTEALAEKGVREVWYVYSAGGYEGSGTAIVRTDAGWDAINLGHCSCNTPCLDWLAGNERATLAEVLAMHSAEAREEPERLARCFGLLP